jgi:hypothetical protein
MNASRTSIIFIAALAVSSVLLIFELARADEPNHFSLYSYPRDGFEAAFPSKPLELRTKKGEELGYVNSYQAIMINPMSQYSVFVNHSPNRVFEDASIDAYLDGTIRGLMMGSKDAVLRYKRRTRFLGFPGLKYQYSYSIEGAPFVGHGIVFIVDGDHVRLSQIYAANNSSASTNFQRFINSFKLTPIDAPLNNQRFEDKSRGVAFSPPEGWEKSTPAYPQVVATYSNASGHSITVLISSAPEYLCNDYKREIQTSQGLQETGQTTLRGRSATWLKSTSYVPAARIRMTGIHYCLDTTRGAVILIGAAPEETFFRSETIFRKAVASMELRN